MSVMTIGRPRGGGNPQARALGGFPIARFRLRHRAAESLWLVPAFYVALAFVLVIVTELLPPIDVISAPQVDATLLTSVAAGMLALAGFVITISFVTVEFASIAMSPRLVGILRRDRQVKRALGLAFGAFVYATLGSLLVHPEQQSVDDIFGVVATAWSILAAIWFVVMLDRITNTLRAGNAVATVGDQARRELEHVHPVLIAADRDEPAAERGPPALEIRDAVVEIHDPGEDDYWDGDRDAPPTQRFLSHGPETLRHEGRPGVLIAADLVRLSRIAEQHATTIELCVPIGRFCPAGSAVLVVEGGVTPELGRQLRGSLAFSSEPTLASDPRHAFRVLVDVGLKGLAPGVNDPTTAVQAIDQMHDLLRRLAWRELGELRVRDAAGDVRVIMPAPTWGHYLRLASEELADFGARHAPVRRHLRVMLDDLAQWAPAARRPEVRRQREHVENAISRLRGS